METFKKNEHLKWKIINIVEMINFQILTTFKLLIIDRKKVSKIKHMIKEILLDINFF